MMATLIVILSMLVVGIQASLLPVHPFNRALVKRQEPTQCDSACAEIVSLDGPLGGSADSGSCQDLACSCTQAAGEAEVSCINCLVGVDPSYDALGQLNTYIGDCSAGGFDFNPPLQVSSSTLTTPLSTLTTPPSTPTTLPSTLTTPPSTLTILPSTLTTPPSTLTTPSSTLTTPPSTLTTPPSTLTTPSSTLTTPPSARTTPHTSATPTTSHTESSSPLPGTTPALVTTANSGTPSGATPQLASYTQSFAPSPSQNSDSTNVTIGVNDPRISTSGPDWTTDTSSCDSSSKSKQDSVAGQTLTLQFNGTAVFMQTVRSDISGQYSVAVDNQSPVGIDGFTNMPNPSCGFGWSAFGLDNAPHVVTVSTLGQSNQAGHDASNFELDGFVITQSTSRGGTSPNVLLARGFHSFTFISVIILLNLICAY